MIKIYYLKKFARQYKKLPMSVKKQAEEKEIIFRKKPFDKKLKTHKLHGDLKGFFAFSINSQIRVIFDFDNDKNIRFYSVGNHDIYY